MTSCQRPSCNDPILRKLTKEDLQNLEVIYLGKVNIVFLFSKEDHIHHKKGKFERNISELLSD